MEKSSGESFDESLRDINNLFLREITREKISLSRSSAYAAAGACMAALLVLISKESHELSLYIASLVFALAIPFLIFIANFNESFLWIGERSHAEYKAINSRKEFMFFQFFAYGLFAIGYFLIIWYLSKIAFVLSFVASFILLSTNSYLINHLKIRLKETIED